MSKWVWWEDYRCGCVSEQATVRKDLPGYCPKHGDEARKVWRTGPDEIDHRSVDE